MNMSSARKDVERWAMGILAGGLCAHTIYLAHRWWLSGHAPIVNLHESLSFFAWFVTVAFLAVQMRYRLKSLGVFVAPIVSVLLISSYSQPNEIMPLPPSLKSFWLPVHAGICIASYSLFATSAAIALMYLLQERNIKTKRFNRLFERLPSLDGLDAMIGRCISIGFPLLTLGIITGSVWAESAWGSYWSWDPKETWSLVTWFFYAALLHQRLTIGWRGRRAAIMTIISFFILLFTFLGVNLLLPGQHSYATRLD